MMQMKDFNEKILPFKDKLYRFSLGIVGNTPEAEDVVQEVFIKMWNSRDKWHEYNNLEAWCMKLTRNLSIDKIRSKHRRVDSLDNTFDMKEGSISPHRNAEINDMMDKIKNLMNQLPENQQVVMRLRDIEGMAYKEIAEILDLSLSQVKVNLFRARQKIKLQIVNTESYGL